MRLENVDWRNVDVSAAKRMTTTTTTSGATLRPTERSPTTQPDAVPRARPVLA
jgi:hypothetical protein